MPDYNKIIAFFDEYITHYREFLQFEYLKMDMINHNQIEKLSTSLSTEQALIMKTNVYETKRLKVLEGTTGSTFAEIAQNAPEEYREKLTAQHKELSEIVFRIKELNDSAKITVTERLKKIQRRTAELDVYDGKGTVKREHASRLAISKNV
ncbi:MAG: flagellar export chaperone FlgN [Oscillospiraceae bacterium]|nr:flagellar export chaperone FlgN [Oscillospiraceae bacterium]